MRIPRIYTGQALQPNSIVELEPGPSQHLSRVLRMKVGDGLILFDGRGGQYPATISAIDRKLVAASTGDSDPVERESGLDLQLGIRSQAHQRFVKSSRSIILASVYLAASSIIPRAPSASLHSEL